MTALLPANAEACTVRFEVAAGPWETIATWDKMVRVASAPGSVRVTSIVDRSPPRRGRRYRSLITSGTTVRLVAVDVEGKILPAEVRSGGGVKDFRQLVVEFDQPPEQIKEFRLQTRPYEEVEIPRIALKRK